MVNKCCFEALDRSLRDVMRSYNPDCSLLPFGGKVVVFCGDFRQILPVVSHGSRHDIVFAAINASYLWDHCTVLRLTQNMRVIRGVTELEARKAKEFSDWILGIGDGTEGESVNGEAQITIPEDLLLASTGDPIATIVDHVYPLSYNIQDPPTYFQERVILAPTNEIVEKVNDYILSLIPGDVTEYLSSDSICPSEGSLDDGFYSSEFLNCIKCSGFPNHVLRLKVGIPIMLMRNIDQFAGSCNGTRLIVRRLGKQIIEAEIISGNNIGHKVFIPRTVLTPTDLKIPVKFRRRQFPVMVCFAMTINKSQGQSLAQVGIYLPRPVFSHGQLYVAISRVTSRDELRIMICDPKGKVQDTTTNVVFDEVFRNII